MKFIANMHELATHHHAHGEKFEATEAYLGQAVGARQLGCSLTIVPPGKRAWPFHSHHVNEEMFIVLAGTGTVRIGDGEYPIRAGDVIGACAGDASTAHQIINTSNEELRYLAISTNRDSEVVEYPDSKTVMVRVGDSSGHPAKRSFFFRGRLGQATEFWEG